MPTESVKLKELISMLSAWDRYPDMPAGSQNFIVNFTDSYFGNVPMKVCLPKNYNKGVQYPLIMILHGGVKMSNFETLSDPYHGEQDGNSTEKKDIFYEYFRTKNYVLLIPVADTRKNFNWSYNQFGSEQKEYSFLEEVNLTYRCLTNAIIKLKSSLNIDDSKVFLLGYSDGSDGTFCMGLFRPTIFAGFILYNSLLFNLNANNIFLNNLKNRPMYIVHSDQDNIRPIEQTRRTIDLGNKCTDRLNYKEYAGYQHFDKHLGLDMPFANKFIQQHERNPFPKDIYFESNNSVDNQCDWLKITGFDLTAPVAAWYTERNLLTFNRNENCWDDIPYYKNSRSYVIKASYSNNCFEICCFGITSFQILISDKMVDLLQPITVTVNAQQTLTKRIRPNKKYILTSFAANFDKQAIWLNAINISVDNNKL